MKMRINTQDKVNLNYFCNQVAEKGSVMGFKSATSQYAEACLWNESKGNPVGVLLSDVVNVDLTRNHINHYKGEVQIGSKVQILTEGKLVWHMGKGLRLPFGQPIYVDPATNKLTWKCLSKQVGKLSSPQDKDGWCLIEVNFLMSIKDIQKEIDELQAKKREILKQKEAADLAEFLKLEWIKETSGSLHISQFLASGINRYEISLYSAKVPDFEYNAYIPIYRSVAFSASGFNVFSMSHSPRQPRLATSNTNDLIDFLSTYRFKSLSFNEEDARLYNFLHNMER